MTTGAQIRQFLDTVPDEVHVTLFAGGVETAQINSFHTVTDVEGDIVSITLSSAHGGVAPNAKPAPTEPMPDPTTEYELVLSKITLIKEIRAATSFGLADAKALVDKLVYSGAIREARPF